MPISKRKRAGRRGWAQRGPLIDHIVTVEVDSPTFYGKTRTTTRDFVVPARAGTRKAELLWLIKSRGLTDLLRKEQYAVHLLNAKDRTITIAEGPHTRGKKVKLR